MSNQPRDRSTPQRRPDRSATGRSLPFDPLLAAIFAVALVVAVAWQGVAVAYRDGQWVAATAIVVVVVAAMVSGVIALERRQRRQRGDR